MFQIKKVTRYLRFILFIPRKVTRTPSSPTSVISDLFPIRSGNNWHTQFELLNVPALISGKSTTENSNVLFCFFDENGNEVNRQKVSISKDARNSFSIPEDFIGAQNAATFAVFHEPSGDQILSSSNIAERGYCGYEFNDLQVRGYVHGNLDSVALRNDGTIETLGNVGILPRKYLVQHVLKGSATYDFTISNPSKKKVKVKVKVQESKKWTLVKKIVIPSKGLRIFSLPVQNNQSLKIKFVSRFYLGRPVVFRTTANSMDVFHG